MNKTGRPPHSQEQIVRQSSLNRATDLLQVLLQVDEGIKGKDLSELSTIALSMAQQFELWVNRPIVLKDGFVEKQTAHVQEKVAEKSKVIKFKKV